MSRAAALLLTLLVLGIGCTAEPTPTAVHPTLPPPPTVTPAPGAWQQVRRLDYGLYSQGAALHGDSDGIAGWTRGQVLYTQYLGSADSAPIALSSGVSPRRVQAFPAPVGGTHWLWLDLTPDGQPRLFTMLSHAEGTLERGKLIVSDNDTAHYSAVADGSGELWVVWRALEAEPTLYMQRIDQDGRPSFPLRLIGDAQSFALLRDDDDRLSLYWTRRAYTTSQSTEQVYHSRLTPSGLSDTQLVGTGLPLSTDSAIVDFRAAQDQTHHYLFWTLHLVDGRTELWFSSGTADLSTWAAPQRLQIRLEDAASSLMPTDFNSGSTLQSAAWPGPIAVRELWPLSSTGTDTSLPTAVGLQRINGDAEVGVLYFREGRPYAYESAARLSASLIGPPTLSTDQRRCLTLSWAMPDGDGLSLYLGMSC